MSDQEKVSKIISGDDQLLKEVYLENFEKIAALVRKYEGDIDDAKDVMQEGLIIMIRNFQDHRFNFKSKINTYLYGICHNVMRARSRKQVRTAGLNDDVLKIVEEEVETIDVEEKNLLMKYLKQMTEECQRILMAHYGYNIAYKTIEEEMNYSSGFGRVKGNRCKNKIRKLMSQDPYYRKKFGL